MRKPSGLTNCIMDKRAKLRRLEDFRRKLPYISQTGLSKVIAVIREEGLPELGDRRDDIREARDTVLTEVTPYGPIAQQRTLVTKTGGTYELDVAHPLAHLWTVAKQGGGFALYLLSCLKQNPPTADRPWRLIVYTDEIVPGNPLGSNNKRKSWVFYFSFLDLGIHALSHEDAWFLVAATRSDNVKAVSAGLSLLGS